MRSVNPIKHHPSTCGQSLAEYVLLIAVVAIACIFGLSVMGGGLSDSILSMYSTGTGDQGPMTGGAPVGDTLDGDVDYDMNYTGNTDLNPDDDPAYDPASITLSNNDVWGLDSICYAGGDQDLNSRCAAIQGDGGVVTENEDGSITREYPNGDLETERRTNQGIERQTERADGTMVEYFESYGGLIHEITTNPDGSSVDRLFDPNAGENGVTTLTTVDEDGNQTVETIPG
jgi:hypothetical protein